MNQNNFRFRMWREKEEVEEEETGWGGGVDDQLKLWHSGLPYVIRRIALPTIKKSKQLDAYEQVPIIRS